MDTRPGVVRTAAKVLTEKGLLRMKPGEKHSDGQITPGAGRLVVRAKSRTVAGQATTVREFFFRYRTADGRDATLLLGQHGKDFSLEDAREAAREKRALVLSGIDPKIDRERETRKNAEEQRADLERQAEEARKGTFADLLDAYATHLSAQGKASARDVTQTLQRHVLKPFPELASTKARDITPDDVSTILARMINKGIERRTNLVRAYLSAAFAYSAKLENDPLRKAEALRNGLETVKRFGVRGNPASDVPPLRQFDRAGDRILSDSEIRGYWQALDAVSLPVRLTLRTAFLLGGQRMSQLVRARWQDYDEQEGTLRLTDGKGRGVAREHVLPVSESVKAMLDTLRTINSGEFIFSATQGAKPLDLSTLSNAVSSIGKRIGEQTGESAFTAADLRRTAETRMAGIGVSKDARAQVLSHGRKSDVQERHYDRNEYLAEKATALAKWEAHVQEAIDGKQTGRVIRGRFRAAS